MASFAVAYMVPRIAYSRLSHYSLIGNIALTLAWLIMGLLGIDYIARGTIGCGGSFSNPHFWFDAQRYLSYAQRLYNHQYTPLGVEPFPGLPLMTAGLWKIFGVNIAYPIAANLMLTLSTIVLTGTLTVRMLRHRTKRTATWLSGVAMAATASLCFFLSHGTQLLKEPLTYFGFIIVALALTMVSHKETAKLHWQTIAIFTLGITIVATTRTTYSNMALIGVFLAMLGNRKHWRTFIAMFIIGIGVYYAVSELANSITFHHYSTYFDSDKASLMSYQFIIGPQQTALGNIVGDYFSYPWWRKLLLLPLTCIVQYIIPFPWTFGEATFSEMLPRFAFTWYAIGGTVIFYIIFLCWRKKTSLKLYPLWIIICFIIPAFVTAGSVSRYILPFQPLMIPMAIYVAALVSERKYLKTFRIFALSYISLIVVLLAVCYQLHVATA